MWVFWHWHSVISAHYALEKYGDHLILHNAQSLWLMTIGPFEESLRRFSFYFVKDTEYFFNRTWSYPSFQGLQA